MLINDASHKGSAVFELLISAAIVVAVGAGVYVVQHPPVAKTPIVQAI